MALTKQDPAEDIEDYAPRPDESRLSDPEFSGAQRRFPHQSRRMQQATYHQRTELGAYKPKNLVIKHSGIQGVEGDVGMPEEPMGWQPTRMRTRQAWFGAPRAL